MSLPHNIVTEQVLLNSGYVESEGVFTKGEATMRRSEGKWALTCPRENGQLYRVSGIGTRNAFDMAMRFCVEAKLEMLKFPPERTIQEYYKELGEIDNRDNQPEVVPDGK